MFMVLLSLIFLVLNLYGAWTSYQRKQWVWVGISLAIALLCASNLWPLLLR